MARIARQLAREAGAGQGAVKPEEEVGVIEVIEVEEVTVEGEGEGEGELEEGELRES